MIGVTKLSPYKDPEKRRKRSKQMMRERRAMMREIDNMTIAHLDALDTGVFVDFAVAHIYNSKSYQRSRYFIISVKDANKCADFLKEHESHVQIIMTKRFFAIGVPIESPPEGSEEDTILRQFPALADRLKETVEETDG